jgi:HD-like signal output (HDOD) protein
MTGLRRPLAEEQRGPVDVEALCATLDSISVDRPVVAQVLAALNDPNADAHRVAAAVETDPAFAAQVMRLANSAFYGMGGRVGNTSFAVTVVGFSAVRSLAAVTATGVNRPGAPKPPGYWQHAAASAAGCSTIAHRFGLAKGDAFAAGLLHDLGVALLHTCNHEVHAELLDEYGNDGQQLALAETERFGMGHDAAAARVLAAWRFPEPFVTAVAEHHSETPSTDPFTQVVRVGDSLAQLSLDPDDDFARDRVIAALGAEQVDAAVQSTRDRAAEILQSLPIS